jgi:hypothetical protein
VLAQEAALGSERIIDRSLVPALERVEGTAAK